MKLTAGLAAALVLYVATSGAMAAPKTIRAVMQADLGILDPVITTGTITADHGAMVYDTLFGIDTDLKPQPQMVGRTVVSDDKLTWTFTLRDGLLWQRPG